MRIPLINCIFYSKFGKCSHLDRGRGFLWLGRSCVLHDTFQVKCCQMIPHARPTGPPPALRPDRADTKKRGSSRAL